MKLVKKIAAIAASLVIATASIGIGVSATNVISPGPIYRPNDFLSYSANYRGTYSLLVVAPLYGSFGISNSDYYGSYKFISYATQQVDATGNLSPQFSGSLASTERNPVCYLNDGTPNAASASREYFAHVNKTSAYSSEQVDRYSIKIYK